MFEIEMFIKMDLALNNLQRLICHKTQQTKPNQTRKEETHSKKEKEKKEEKEGIYPEIKRNNVSIETVTSI